MISCTSAETFNGLCMMNRIFILHIFCVYSVQIFFQYFLYQYFKTFDRLCCKWKYFLFLHYLFLKRHTSIAYKFIVKYNYNFEGGISHQNFVLLIVRYHFWNKFNCSKTDIWMLLYLFEMCLVFSRGEKSDLVAS